MNKKQLKILLTSILCMIVTSACNTNKTISDEYEKAKKKDIFATAASFESVTEPVTELHTEPVTEPEIIHNYQDIRHDSSHQFYDFIEQNIDELTSLNEEQSVNKAYMEKVLSAFETDMAAKEIYFTDIQTQQIYDIDFDRDSVYETIILYEGVIDSDKSTYIESSNPKDGGATKYMGLYFVAADGTITHLAAGEHVSIGYLYVYPREKQLAVFCYEFLAYFEYFFGYDGKEMKMVLWLNDSVEKDNCFLSQNARVGVYHPVSPKMYYWNSERFEYVPLNANEISIDDFIEKYNGSEIMKELGINDDENECEGICTIGNYKYILFLKKRGNAVVSRNENNSYTIDIEPHSIGVTLYDDVLLDVDYFEACHQMISVEEW